VADPSTKRFHVVLVPGFAGFDALGQLEYYGGITPLFQAWRAENQVLHYFDNFPYSGGGHARNAIAELPCQAHGAR